MTEKAFARLGERGDAVSGTDAAIMALTTLADTLKAEDALTCKVVHPRGAPPFLRVVHLAAGQLTEDVSVTDDGGHYLWSWGERISSTTHPEIAGAAIIRVLAPQGTWRP
jgi:hypothetical protein